VSLLIQFIILKRKGKWSVKSDDLERVFSIQHEAMTTAVRLANESGKNGKPSVVILQRAKNKFEKIWIYGKSPYPPSRSDLLPVRSRVIDHRRAPPEGPDRPAHARQSRFRRPGVNPEF
jgi:hypothetical protein